MYIKETKRRLEDEIYYATCEEGFNVRYQNYHEIGNGGRGIEPVYKFMVITP